MRFVRRPWGWWLVLLDRPRFKVKLLKFVSGRSLSLQYHNHRNELWLFLKGEGNFWLDKDNQYCRGGEFRLVDVAKLHKYRATTNTYVLEIQYGERCFEEDIVRV